MAKILLLLENFQTNGAFRSALFGSCIVLMGAFGAWQGMQFSSALQREMPTIEPTALAQDATKPGKTILSKNLVRLFGTAPELTEDDAPSGQLPESNLNLQVSAIFFMGAPGQSSVILEDGDRTLILRSGEEVRPGVAIQKIESARITLKRNDKLEQISFRGFDEGASGNDLDNLPAIAQTAPNEPSAPPASSAHTAQEQKIPAAYQQYIQRKLAQNK